MRRIVDAAARLFGDEGFEGASMNAVARAAGVSKGLLHYHFRNKEHLLIEAQRAAFQEIHRQFDQRFEAGDVGMPTALEALDTLWGAVREMRGWAPFLVETMSIRAHSRSGLRKHLDAFYAESMSLLEEGIVRVFESDLDRLVMPPDRLANIVRTTIHGLIVELAFARGRDDLARLDQTYQDLRLVFSQIALTGPEPGPQEVEP